jgi:hypothetical protein
VSPLSVVADCTLLHFFLALPWCVPLPAPPHLAIAPWHSMSRDRGVVLQTSQGLIALELYWDEAPKTCEK